MNIHEPNNAQSRYSNEMLSWPSVTSILQSQHQFKLWIYMSQTTRRADTAMRCSADLQWYRYCNHSTSSHYEYTWAKQCAEQIQQWDAQLTFSDTDTAITTPVHTKWKKAANREHWHSTVDTASTRRVHYEERERDNNNNKSFWLYMYKLITQARRITLGVCKLWSFFIITFSSKRKG